MGKSDGRSMVGHTVILTMQRVCIDCAPDERGAREALGFDPDEERVPVMPASLTEAQAHGLECAVCGVRLDMRRARA